MLNPILYSFNAVCCVVTNFFFFSLFLSIVYFHSQLLQIQTIVVLKKTRDTKKAREREIEREKEGERGGKCEKE